MEKIIAKITTAKNAGFPFAFVSELSWAELNIIKSQYEVTQGWNNKYMTGYSLMEFGYLIKL
jgi:hypothetical protein